MADKNPSTSTDPEAPEQAAPQAPATEVKKVPGSRGPKPGAKKGKGIADAPADANEIKGTLHLLFNGFAKLARSDAEFSADEFKNISAGIVDAVNLFPPIRVFLRVLKPLSIAGDIIDKVRRIRDGRRKPQPNANQSA